MAKDLNPNQFIENKPSLQEQQRKHKEKEDAATESMKSRCRLCFKEIAPKRMCGGHGGGGGGGGGGSDNSSSRDSQSEKSMAATNLNAENNIQSFQGDPEIDSLSTEDFATNQTFAEKSPHFQPEENEEERFDAKVIFELLAKNILTVDMNRDLKTITIKLQRDPDLLTEELTEEQNREFKKYIDAILEELENFQEENQITKCGHIERDEDGNIVSVRIKLPTLELYDRFIQRLAQNLLPDHKAQSELSNSTPTPLAKKPVPTEDSTKKEEDEFRKDDVFNPSPLSTHLKP